MRPGGAHRNSLTTQFVFNGIFYLERFCARHSCVLESAFRRAPLSLLVLFGRTSAAEGVANRHCDQALETEIGDTSAQRGVSEGRCRAVTEVEEGPLDLGSTVSHHDCLRQPIGQEALPLAVWPRCVDIIRSLRRARVWPATSCREQGSTQDSGLRFG